MTTRLYLDTARFGAILPECAEMLREFATLLETEGQFPLFEAFLRDGSRTWPSRLTERFPTLSRWQGLLHLRRQISELCGLTDPTAILFASSSRNLARVAFHLLDQHCERILCSDADWPDFQEMLRKHLTHAESSLYVARLNDPLFIEERSQEERLVSAYVRHQCDGCLLTAVSADGLSIRIENVLQKIHAIGQQAYCVVDGSQQVGHLPINLGPDFNGIYLAGTHKWLRSGVPMSFAIVVNRPGITNTSLLIRKALRQSQTDDSLLLQTADVGLECPRQTSRLEPLIAASLAVERTLKDRVESLLAVRQRNARHLFEIMTNLQLDFEVRVQNGIVTLRLDTPDMTAAEIQRQFSADGLTVSIRDERQLRISCPAVEFTAPEIQHLWMIFGKRSDRYCTLHGS